MANLRAGLIGLGSMGRHHARVLRALEGVDLVGVADGMGDAHGVAGGLEVAPDIETLLKAGLDYVVVAVPTIYHEPVALAVAEAGVHALVEKPLGHDTASAERIATAFESRGLVGAVGHIERYNPAVQSLRARLENGELGDVYQIATRRQGPFPARIADVGVVRDLGPHDIDLAAWVAQSTYASVSAQVAHRSGREHEDLVSITGRLANGTVTSHLINWLSPMKERATIVTGERGAFVADTLTADLTFFENGTIATTWDQIAGFRGVSEGNVTRFAIAKAEPLATEHAAFRDGILGKSATYVTMREGLETVAVVDAVLESARTGTTINR
ncbi:Gfo/Idh/MocA family oxidoreductase [Demequina sp. TTPB684]|uniref:Gfo/Idh/MocA family protein n=1 Tax=unclassified Demequina TaxID=2620311 RepID=UPI001CF3CD29|nr:MULTISPECIES: Gfo/Idh/MocA family oxidoreductase [unclassified Demequina]MCB2413626.1 Gfo/Idh/MocA family oxidoreductase [Demequina sp. TTPB684]UPU88251.1 Gfo/Idh/MocA family oxidoreductase [Demequina sp. TMPB413]